eukprot:s750_g33.t1
MDRVKNLYEATTHLKKSKKHLAEVADHQKAHRARWMAHLSTGIQTWEKQLFEFKRHQASLAEQAGRARHEIAAASRVIQLLGHTEADGGTVVTPTAPAVPPAPEQEEHVEDKVDKEEADLRAKFQIVLRNCASSPGLSLTGPEIVEVPDEAVEEELQPQKRPRSLEPFAAPAPG